MMDQASLHSQLIGAWELVSYVANPVDSSSSSPVYPFGTNAQGIVSYSAEGYMSAQLQYPGQAKLATAFPTEASESELAECTRRYIGYAGPYTLDYSSAADGKGPVLVHHFVVSSFPNWRGEAQRRVFKIDGDLLTLTTETPVDMKVGFLSFHPRLFP